MSNLEETIKLKDKELYDVKSSIADILQTIRDLIQNIDKDNIDTKRREISELATNTIYELRQDLFEEKKEELSTTDKSNR